MLSPFIWVSEGFEEPWALARLAFYWQRIWNTALSHIHCSQRVCSQSIPCECSPQRHIRSQSPQWSKPRAASTAAQLTPWQTANKSILCNSSEQRYALSFPAVTALTGAEECPTAAHSFTDNRSSSRGGGGRVKGWLQKGFGVILVVAKPELCWRGGQFGKSSLASSAKMTWGVFLRSRLSWWGGSAAWQSSWGRSEHCCKHMDKAAPQETINGAWCSPAEWAWLAVLTSHSPTWTTLSSAYSKHGPGCS